jgi:hypothetical protein
MNIKCPCRNPNLSKSFGILILRNLLNVDGNKVKRCCGFHGHWYEDCDVLGCNVTFCKEHFLTFQMNIIPSLWGVKRTKCTILRNCLEVTTRRTSVAFQKTGNMKYLCNFL